MVYETMGLAYYSKYAIDNAPTPERAAQMRAEDRAIEAARLDDPAVTVMLKKAVLDMVYGDPARNMLSAEITKKIRDKYFPAGQLRTDPSAAKANLVLTAGNQPVITYKTPENLATKDVTAKPVPKDYVYPASSLYHFATIQYMKNELAAQNAPLTDSSGNIINGHSDNTPVPGNGSPAGIQQDQPMYHMPPKQPNYMPVVLAAGAGLLAFLAMR